MEFGGPFSDNSLVTTLSKIKITRVRFPARCSSRLNPNVKDLIWRLICVDVKARMHVSMMHLHEWMRRPIVTTKSTLGNSSAMMIDNQQPGNSYER